MQFTPTQKHVASWLLIALLAVLALWLLGRVLTPFVVAAVLAYALTPLVDRLDALGRGRMPRVIVDAAGSDIRYRALVRAVSSSRITAHRDGLRDQSVLDMSGAGCSCGAGGDSCPVRNPVTAASVNAGLHWMAPSLCRATEIASDAIASRKVSAKLVTAIKPPSELLRVSARSKSSGTLRKC